MNKLVIGVMIAAYVPIAHAEDDVYDYSWNAPEMASGIGIAFVAGAGVMGYTSGAVRDNTSSVGGLWQLRATLGTHIPVGLDLGYVGTATGVQSLVGTFSGTLLTTNLEGALRFNILPHVRWNPYIFGGVGWAHLNVTGAAFTLADSGIKGDDNEIEFPAGAGISYRSPSGFIADLRGTYRFTGDANLIISNPGQTVPQFASMNWWEASAAAGFEF